MHASVPVRRLAGLLAGALLTLPATAGPVSPPPRHATTAAETAAIHRRVAAKDAVIADLRRRLAQVLAENARLKGWATVPGVVPETAVTRVPVVFSGGHDTEPRDGGRPVALVAGALGVPAEVFRDAFSRVRPAPAGEPPDPQQVGANKAALLTALGQYGVTNERLDAVSDYYRYVRSRGELWPTRAATAYALVRSGAITGFVVTAGGSGYNSPPTVTVPGVAVATGKTTLSFSRRFPDNGAVSAILLPSGPPNPHL